MKNKNKQIVLFSLVLTCLAGFVAMLIMLKLGYDFKIDKLNILLCNNQNPFIVGFFKVFTYLGSWWVMALIAGILVIFCKDKKVGITCFICLAVSALFNLSFKYVVCRPRPELMLIDEIGFSFPSAHAMMSLTFYGCLIYFACLNIKNKASKILCSIALILIIMLLGFSRIVLNVHFASDILAGFLLGLVSLYVGLKLGKIIDKKQIQ